MATREQWYKPNLLYNIHYRPPKKSDEPDQSKSQEQAKKSDQPKKQAQPKNSAPPKMVVDTIRFNPSVCTCGKHGCKPHYRMERKVRWVNEEEQNGAATMKENEGRFDCNVGGVEVNCKDKGEIGAEVNERRCKERFDKNDGKTGVEESNGRSGGDKRGDDRCIAKADDGKNDNGEGGDRCADRVYSDDGDGKRDGRVDYNEGDSRCDDSLSGDKDRRCEGRYDSNLSDGRIDSDGTKGRCKGRIGTEEKENECYDRADGCTDNVVTADSVDESDEKCDSGVGIVADDDRFDGSVGNHEFDERGDDKSDSGSLDHVLDVESDSSSVCTNAILEDDTDEIASAFGIMSIYCNSELHSCGRVQDKTDEEFI